MTGTALRRGIECAWSMDKTSAVAGRKAMRAEVSEQGRAWFWITLTLSSISVAAFVFALWELVENHYFRDVDYVTLHYLYISRGIVTSLILAFWAAWFVLRERRASEEQLRRSRERYRGILESAPSAVALYDRGLAVSEWNSAAEKLYGYPKTEVIGGRLPTVPQEKDDELEEFLHRVEVGEEVLDIETLRRTRDGVSFEVQLSLLPFRESSGETLFLEVTYDIRERVRLRQALLELEKLTTMGQMAAGTAHYLNTPLAAMLLRVQMMREESAGTKLAVDLEQLERNMRFCEQFVRRLLDFSRRPRSTLQPESLTRTVEAVVSFFSPQIDAKRAQLVVDVRLAEGAVVMADRGQLEALLLILLSNAMDAIEPAGHVWLRCRLVDGKRAEIRVCDDGCGIEESNFERIFVPFFTTKPVGKGTGLGLALARSIVHQHRGSIRIESAVNQGTTAIVELPVSPAASDATGGV
jgi:two-component system, sporulation sensor kinase A